MAVFSLEYCFAVAVHAKAEPFESRQLGIVLSMSTEPIHVRDSLLDALQVDIGNQYSHG